MGIKQNLQKSKSSDTKTEESLPVKKRPRRLWLKILIAVFIVLLLCGGAMAYKLHQSFSKVIQKNEGTAAEALKTETVAPEKLKGEGDGRINILLMGVGNAGHAGEQLSDTLIVASYDPQTHDVAMLSIPRDFYVKIDGNGYAKINSAHAFGEMYKEGSGPELAKKTVSQVLGIPIHYYVKVNFTALKQAVDSVGGVDVVVSESLTDPEYPCERNDGMVCGYSIMAGNQHMNGSAALKYVRCRKGDCGDDFGRAKRQQDILVALREKANSQNLLTNPAKITEIMGIVSQNFSTDLQLWEIERLSKIAKEIDPNTIVSKVLDNETNHLVTTSDINGASVVIPSGGVGYYKDIQAYVRTIFVDGYIKKEAATIDVQNGTPYNNRTQLVTDMLKSYNYNVVSSGQAPTQTVKATQIIDYTGGKKPYTIQYLQKRLGLQATTAPVDANNPPPADIQIIIGADYKTS